MVELEKSHVFDESASTYDEYFTDTPIGRLQRNRVWRYLRSYSKDKARSLKILELNCGTGEDAIWLANQGHVVVATDISVSMITLARSKANQFCNGNLRFEVADITTIDKQIENHTFDLIFSNFGGFNCLNYVQIEKFSLQAADLLSDNGSVILVLMPKVCIVEDMYLASRLNFRAIGRRYRNEKLSVKINDNMIDTWYYSSKSLRKVFTDVKIGTKKIFPIGFTPSYLNPFFSNKILLFKIWSSIGKLFSYFPISDISDHYLIHFERN